MSEEGKHLIELLNDMFQSQSSDFKQRYRENYFGLLEYLVNSISDKRLLIKLNEL